MLYRLSKRFLTEPDPRLLWKFAYTFGWKGMRTVMAFEKRKRSQPNPFPAFLVLSITTACNLRCRGCWVTPRRPDAHMTFDQMDHIVTEGKRNGSFFFGLLGGEPMLHPRVLDVIARHPDAYFQIFTNGTLMTDELAAELRRLGNVTPLISIEGNPAVSDQRRGARDVYRRSLDGLECCRRHRLVTGVATSVCRTNIDDLVSDSFLNELVRRGALYVWYYIYRPVGPDPAPELALCADEIVRLRRFIVERRRTSPLIIVDAYWDQDGQALCPAAVGLSHHIGPAGDIEYCPPIQFAVDHIADRPDLADIFRNSGFLSRFRELSARTTRGCILLEHPELMKEFLEREGAHPTSGRQTAWQELAAMSRGPGHHLPGREIPERQPLYRFAKKHWFFGFGAYG